MENKIQEFLFSKPGYLKKNPAIVAEKLGVPIEEVKKVFKFIKENKLPNHSLTPLQEKLNELEVPLHAVKRVKFWDKQNGEQGFTITPHDDWHKEGLQQSIEDSLKRVTEKFRDTIVPLKINIKEKDNNKALFIYLSDKHIGAHTANHSLFQNPYNKEIFRERLLHTLETIQKNKDLFGVFDTLYLCDLGDALDGFNGKTTRGGHHLPQNMDNHEQIDTFFECHRDLFDSIMHMQAAKKIEYIACTNSNHDGQGWSYAANKVLDIYLECKYPDIKKTIITKFMDHIQYGQHTFIFTHGKDDSDLKFGLPAKLNEKTENYINSYIHHHKIQTPGIHLIKGDLHLASEEYGKIFRYKNVLSLYGSSKWVMTSFITNTCGYCYEVVDKYSKEIYRNQVEF